jgi:hypothetical protein
LQTFTLFATAYFLFYLFYLWRSLRAAAVRITSSVAHGLRVGAITILISVLPHKLLLSWLPLQYHWHQLFAIGLCILLTLLCYAVLFAMIKRSARNAKLVMPDPVQTNIKNE